MAQRFVEQAAQQLAPVYDQQAQTMQAQIPVIQQMYQTLMQGLEGSTAKQISTGTQAITGDASRRGVLRSTIPVASGQRLQETLGAALAEGLSKLGFQQQQDIAGVNQQVGELGIQKAGAIQSLADTLYGRDLKEREFQWQQQQAERDHQFKLQQLAAQQAMARSSGGGGSGGGSGGNPANVFINDFAKWMSGQKSMASRQAQDAYINSLFDQYGIRDKGARQIVWDAINAQFKRVSDPTKDWTWAK